MRLGGIYALEGVMNGSQQYHQPVLEALCAFVRDGTIGKDKAVGTEPAADIQAALTVLARRGDGGGRVDLAKANIQGAVLTVANLTGANLTGTNLTGANLGSARLSDANLRGAVLSDASLSAASLTLANLTGANLTGAVLTIADLTGAVLTGANLSGANLTYADLRGALLLTQAQLDQACGAYATLPRGLTLKPCPSKPAAPPALPGH